MNAPLFHRNALMRHASVIEARHPLRIVDLLPRGSAAHVSEDDALDLLAEKRPGLDLVGLCEAEAELADLLGRPVGIFLVGGLRGREATEFPRLVEPL